MAKTSGNDDTGQALAERIAALIADTAHNAPRSLQKRLGPSEVGDPCERRLSYKELDWPRSAADGDPAASIIGTGFHSWMEEAFTRRQTTLPDGRPRYKIEERVTVQPSPIEAAIVAGSTDLFDRATGTVWDWKLVGHTTQDKYRRGGPGPQYRIQAHLYGLGQENAGETVNRVAICFVARYHELRVHVWTEPYQRDVAKQALARLGRIRANLTSPEAAASGYDHTWWSQIPTSEQAKCRFCEWFKPSSTDLTVGCPGIQAAQPARHGFESLIA
ncbi:hypothetical protein [Streptomyces sp. RK76]|uniref:hypothetical protein n=1 Tax=Streptomyces sp. RK76 TaxID=2824896 RepID=UPI001B393750|nr:hypothetical protein [Streptomyces sp. RK76]MBQ0947683.1 hypothetical protein [Streptomyces sp. RK76]